MFLIDKKYTEVLYGNEKPGWICKNVAIVRVHCFRGKKTSLKKEGNIANIVSYRTFSVSFPQKHFSASYAFQLTGKVLSYWLVFQKSSSSFKKVHCDQEGYLFQRDVLLRTPGALQPRCQSHRAVPTGDSVSGTAMACTHYEPYLSYRTAVICDNQSSH